MKGHLTVLDGLSRLPGPKGERFAQLFHHGSLSVEFYAPRGSDPQTPHTRDEIYVIVSGKGRFRMGDHEVETFTGDVLFAPAGKEHRFMDFTDDFATWVFFYGPEGGETDQ